MNLEICADAVDILDRRVAREDHGVRITHRDAVQREIAFAARKRQRRISLRRAHIDAHALDGAALDRQLKPLDPGLRLDFQRIFRRKVYNISV